MLLSTILLAEVSQNIAALRLQLDYERAKIITALGGEPALYKAGNALQAGVGPAVANATLQVDGAVVVSDGAGGVVASLDSDGLYQTSRILHTVKSGTYSGSIEILIPDLTLTSNSVTNVDTGINADTFGASQRALWYAESVLMGEYSNAIRSNWSLSCVKFDGASPAVTGTLVAAQSYPTGSYITQSVVSVDESSNLIMSITNASAYDATSVSVSVKLLCTRW